MLEQDPTRTNVIVFDEPVPDDYRIHMAVVFAPWINASGSYAERGYNCTLCFHTDRGLQNLTYTRYMFLQHLKDCRVRPLDKFAMGGRRPQCLSLAESE